jgi:tetratricopeptide (TPR) repeat protein
MGPLALSSRAIASPWVYDFWMDRTQFMSATMGHVALALLASTLSSCSRNPADREYLAALRGEEEGMSRKKQIAHIDRAIELEPRRAHYWETRAIYRIDLRNFDRAKADLDQAVKLQDRPYLRFLRGLVLCQSGRPEDALPDFDAAISGQPENSQFYRGRALALAAVGRASEALNDAERLIKAAPQMGESYYARGIALTKLGRDEEAIKEFTEALRRRPELIYPLRARADSYERTGEPMRAADDRAEAAKREKERMHCAPCSDPFRY